MISIWMVIGGHPHTNTHTKLFTALIVIESDCIVRVGRLPGTMFTGSRSIWLLAAWPGNRKITHFSLCFPTRPMEWNNAEKLYKIFCLHLIGSIEVAKAATFFVEFQVRPLYGRAARACARSLRMWWQLDAFQPNENRVNCLITPEQRSFHFFSTSANLGHSNRPSVGSLH